MKVFLLTCLVALALAREKEELIVPSESSESISNSQESNNNIHKKLEKVKQVEQQQREAEIQDKIHAFAQPQFPVFPFANPIPYTAPQAILPVAQPAMVPSSLPVFDRKLMDVLKAKAIANPLKNKQMFPPKPQTVSPQTPIPTDPKTQHLSQLQLQSLLQQDPQPFLQLQSLLQHQEPQPFLQLQSLLQQNPQPFAQPQSLVQQNLPLFLQLQSLLQQNPPLFFQLQSLQHQVPQSFVQTHLPFLQLQEQPLQPEVLSLLQQVASFPQKDVPVLDALAYQYLLLALTHQIPETQAVDFLYNQVV